MPLDSGRRLGPYEILSPLGAGGMGEVYEAKDTRLGRTVAIKVLPEGLAESPERRARFEREARTVSQLTHPHVCTLHDVGEEEGIHFLVMEHLEGETLAERLGRGALPLEETLRFGAQIAEALDAAHRRGVVHRDLKPANVMLTSSGVKLLDFGLARMAAGGGAAEEVADLPTMTIGGEGALTDEGTVLGTFPYMSPEQVEGAEADARSDIFGLGAVLYEMATGERAFTGESAASVMAAVLREEPEPITKVEPVSPPALDHVVSRCLAKDPERRWQTARDVAEELRWIREAGSQAGVAAPVAKRRKSRERLAWEIAVLFALTALALGADRLMRERPEPAVTRTLVSLPGGAFPWAALSPDGDALVAEVDAGEERGNQGARKLWLRPLDSLDARPLAGTEGALGAFFSPDGEWIGYTDLEAGELRKIPSRGGRPLTVARGVGFGFGAWSVDDTIVFTQLPPPRGSGWGAMPAPGEMLGPGLWKVPAAGGEPERVAIGGETTAYIVPEVLPGGDVALVQVGGFEWSETPWIVAVNLETGEETRITEGSVPKYLPPGYLVFLDVGPDFMGALMATPFDPERLELDGEPRAALPDGSRVAGYALSRNGVLAYPPEGTPPGFGTFVWVDREGETEPLDLEPVEVGTLRISPDGRRVAATWDEVQLHLIDLDRGAAFDLPSPPGSEYNPIWTPDGRSLLFASSVREETGTWDIFRLDLGADRSEPVLEDPDRILVPEDLSPDGSTLILEVHGPGENADLFALRIEGEPELGPLLETPAHEEFAQLSPDGRFLAYTSDPTGKDEVYLAPYPEMNRRWQVSVGGGTHPLWSPEGDEILYRQGDRILAVPLSVQGEISVGRPVPIVEGQFGNSWDVAPDGRLLMVRLPERQTRDLVLVTNWHLELERLFGEAPDG